MSVSYAAITPSLWMKSEGKTRLVNVTMKVENPAHTLGYPAGMLTMRDICTQTAIKHGLTLQALRGPRRTRDLAQARQEAMWRMVEANKWSTTQIGRFLGRDHSTVIHGHRRHAKRLAEQ